MDALSSTLSGATLDGSSPGGVSGAPGATPTASFAAILQLQLASTRSEIEDVRSEIASLSYTGIESHKGLRHYGLCDTVVAKV